MTDFEKIEGFNYEVNSEGVVRRVCNNGSYKIMKPRTGTRGYLQVQLCKDSKHVNFKIHRLIATYFIPNLENKPYVDHIDRNRLNNCVSNLRWVSHEENMMNQDSYKEPRIYKTTEHSGMYTHIYYRVWYYDESNKRKSRRFKTEEEALLFKIKL